MLNQKVTSPNRMGTISDDTVFASTAMQETGLPHQTVALSFQLMTRAEPPEMVIETIRSLLAIKHDADEILIVDNNHNDTALYQPLERFCATLDSRLKVRFYHFDKIEGFKAGALNLALNVMDSACSHIVVVDSDYQALANARIAITSAISRHPTHSLLQFPQFYRDEEQPDVHSELNHYFNYHLYRKFNRTRALSTGTYAVIRCADLVRVGGWSGDSLTEDAQMGVLMHQHGMRSAFIPTVIATGLLPNTLEDLMNQRRRWIYGNMQILNNYMHLSSTPRLYPSANNTTTLSLPRSKLDALLERMRYQRAHFSQLSAWVNFTGIFILLQTGVLVAMSAMLIVGTYSAALQVPLYAVYLGYSVFLLRRLWAYYRDQAPLNLQDNSNHQDNHTQSGLTSSLHAWLIHLNFWELGALSWLPVLWGREKPFICTPKQKHSRSRFSLWRANLKALPKLLFGLNALTALMVAPYSPFYSPILFGCAIGICTLKLAAAKVAFDNYAPVSTALSLVQLSD